MASLWSRHFFLEKCIALVLHIHKFSVECSIHSALANYHSKFPQLHTSAFTWQLFHYTNYVLWWIPEEECLTVYMYILLNVPITHFIESKEESCMYLDLAIFQVSHSGWTVFYRLCTKYTYCSMVSRFIGKPQLCTLYYSAGSTELMGFLLDFAGLKVFLSVVQMPNTFGPWMTNYTSGLSSETTIQIPET